jgi:polar amino acid transport system substrate-binding protein
VKKIFAFIAFITFAVVFIGCEKKDDSYKKVIEKGELVIGLDAYYPPMGFYDQDGDIVGFDIDLAVEVCARMGIKLKTVPINWDNKEHELNSGAIDCIWNGMSVDSARASSMSLSDPYLKNGMYFVVKDSSLANMDSLKNRRIALQKGSTSQDHLVTSEIGMSAKEIVAFEDNLKALAALDSGDVDVVYMDKVIAEYLIFKSKKEYFLWADPHIKEKLAIGFRKNDLALRDAVNDMMKAMKVDGRFVKISMKWFGK